MMDDVRVRACVRAGALCVVHVCGMCAHMRACVRAHMCACVRACVCDGGEKRSKRRRGGWGGG